MSFKVIKFDIRKESAHETCYAWTMITYTSYLTVASLGWVTPGAATGGVTPLFFSWKTWRPFFSVTPDFFFAKTDDLLLLIALSLFIAFTRVSPRSSVSPHTFFYLPDLVSSLFFVNLPTKKFFIRVSPPGGCHPGRSAPRPPLVTPLLAYTVSECIISPISLSQEHACL